MDNYNYSSIFDSGDNYKPSYLRDVTRLHFLYNNDEDYSYEEEVSDRYKGVFSETYQNYIDRKSNELGASYQKEITREAMLNRASYNLTSRTLNNTNNVFRNVFSSFSTPDLFEDSGQDGEYGRELLHDFSNFLVQERSEREAENIIPIMRMMDSVISEAVDADIENSIDSSSRTRRDIENFQRKAWNTEATIDNITGGGYTRANKLLNKTSYRHLPSILPDSNEESTSGLTEAVEKMQGITILDYYNDAFENYINRDNLESKLTPEQQQEKLKEFTDFYLSAKQERVSTLQQAVNKKSFQEQQLDRIKLIQLYFQLSEAKKKYSSDLNDIPDYKEQALITLETTLNDSLMYNLTSIDNEDPALNSYAGEDKNINKLLSNGYVTRPGVLPAVGLLHDAKNKLTISLYQLQNATVLDYYTDNLIRRAEEFNYKKEQFDKGELDEAPIPFNFNLTLAYNLEQSNSDVGYNILGPNLEAIRRFQRIQELYNDSLDININISDRKNHTKLFVSDNQAYISTQNQTNPVGKSIYQSGSNYEAGLILQRVEDPKTIQENADNKLFAQVKAVEALLERLPENGKLLQTGQANISGPMETYEMMRASVEYLEANKTSSKLDLILDQVFLLEYDSLLFNEQKKGEMGPESSKILEKYETELSKKQRKYQEEIQKPLMLALIENRAFVQTDVRNYREKIQDPIFKYLIENQPDFADSGYSLSKFLNVDKTKSTQEKITQLMSDRNISESMAIQLLAMNSGNIQTSNVARQHVKGSILYEVDSSGLPKLDDNNIVQALGGELSSSNRGVYSMALDNTEYEQRITNNELGVMQYSDSLQAYFDHKKILDNSNLTELEKEEKLKEFSAFYFKAKEDIRSKKAGDVTGTGRAGYENQVDRTRLMELYFGLKKVKDTTNSAIKLNIEYDSQGPIALQVDVGNGLKYNFAPQLSGDGTNPGFVYETNKSKVIGFSEFINQSSTDINTGFMRDSENLTIKAGERATLSPIENTISIISTIALESEQIGLIKAPLIEYQNLYAPGLEGNKMLPGSIANYLLYLAQSNEVAGNALDPLKVTSGDLIEGVHINLQAKLRNSDSFTNDKGETISGKLDKIRQIAGIDITSSERQANLTYLTDLIQIYANANASDREKMLTGEGMDGRESLYSFLPKLLQSPEYADLLYIFVNAQNDPLYKKSTDKYVKEVSSRVFDPYLYKTQVSTYNSTQAYNQRVLYGVTERRENVVNSINNAFNNQLHELTGLAAYALASSPFEHDATADLGINPDGSLLFLEITGTGGSREKTGLEYKGYKDYEAIHPYYQHKTIGTATDLRLIQDTNVGNILSIYDLDKYRESIAHLGDDLADQIIQQTKDAFKGNERLVMFNFDVAKKASQIPQRIKNVVGSRPTIEITSVYQELLEKGNSLHKGFTSDTSVYTSVELQNAYLEDLRNQLPEHKQHLLDESFGIGALAGSKIKSVLSDDIATILESVRQQIESEFEVDTRDGGIGSELLRARLVYLDTIGSGERGFTGSSKRTGDSVMLFQLSGAYSDYSFLNPMFGGEDGMRTGFLDRTVKGQQGSKLYADSSTSGGNFDTNKELLVASGDTFRKADDSNQVYQYRYNPLTGQHERLRIVDNKKEFAIYENVIEKVSQDPSISNLKATSNAASFTSEYAIEDLKSVKLLEGKPDSNEIRTEIEFFRTKVHGGGGRQESLTGGLFKMVPIYLYDSEEENPGLLRNVLTNFNVNRSGSFGGEGRDVQFEQFYGIVNPSNMKSYFYEHGSEILIDSVKKQSLLRNDEDNNQKLAASLLMAFGIDKFGQQAVSNSALVALVQAASSNKLGTYFKDQYISTVISDNTTDNVEIGKSFIKGATTDSRLQVRTLEYIGLELIERTLRGDSEAGKELNTKLQTLLDDPTRSAVNTEYTNIGDARGREMAILAASLDFFVQLSNAKVSDVAIVNTEKDTAAYLSLGTIGGKTYDELIDPENVEDLQALTNMLARKSYLIGMNMSVVGSQSKVAISSKMESFIENQHIIWEPFYADSNKFKKGGSLSSLRHLMAGFFGTMSGGYTGEFLDATKGIQQIDLLGNYARGPLFKSKMMGVYSSPAINDTQFKELQKNYELFGILQTLISPDDFNYEDDKNLINNVIDSYRKNAKGVDRFNLDFEKLIESIKTSDDVFSLKQNIEKGYNYTIKEFENINENFRLSNTETTSGQAKSSGLQRSAGAAGRFAFNFPTMEFLSNGEIRVHKKENNFSFSLAGEDVNMIGSAFGNFENPIQKSQTILWEAFAEGSDVSNFLDYVASQQKDIVNISNVNEETYKKVQEFYQTASLMPEELTEAIGAYSAKVMGGSKVGFDGGTTTPAAFFMGSTLATMLPKAILERHGGGEETERQKAHKLFLDKATSVKSVSNLLEFDKLLIAKESLTKTKENNQLLLNNIENEISAERNNPKSSGNSLNKLLEHRASLITYLKELDNRNLDLESLRLDYLDSSEYRTHMYYVQQLEDVNKSNQRIEYEIRSISREIKVEKLERDNNLKIRQSVESPYINTIREINSLIQPFVVEKTELKNQIQELNLQKIEVKEKYGINEIEKQLRLLNLERPDVNKEIALLIERKNSLIDERKYLENSLTSLTPRVNKTINFERATVIDNSNYLSEEITNLQFQIDSLITYRNTLDNKTPISLERAEYNQDKKKYYLEEYTKAIRSSGVNVIDSQLTYTHERINELNLGIQPLLEMRGSLESELISQKQSHTFQQLEEEIKYQNETINNLYVERQNKETELKNNLLLSQQLSDKVSNLNNNTFLTEGNLEIQKLDREIRNIKIEISELTTQIESGEQNKDLYELLNSRKKIEAANLVVSELITQTNQDIKSLKKDHTEKTFLISAANTISKGISAEGSKEISNLQKTSIYYQEQIELIKSSEDFNRLQTLNEQLKIRSVPELVTERNTLRQQLGIDDLLNKIEGQINPEDNQTLAYYKNQLKGSNVKEGGDSFISLLGLSEVQTLRAELLSLGYSDTDFYDNKEVNELIKFGVQMKSTMSPIEGLLVGSESETKAYISAGDLQGQMRRGSSKLTDSLELNVNSLKNYEDATAVGYLKKTIDSVIEFSKNKEIQLMEDHKDLMTAQQQGKFDNLYTTLGKYNERLNSPNISRDEINDLTMIIESEVQRFHAELSLGNVQANRPAPLGNPYLGQAKYDVFGMTELNNLMSSYDLPISFAPPSGNNRNDTLQLFNPFSWKVAEGGDFDGDMILNIFNTSSTLKLKMAGYENKISSLKEDKLLKQSKLIEYQSNNDLDKANNLIQQLDKIDSRISNLSSQVVEIDATIKAIEGNRGVQDYQKNAARWVGNYLKVDPNMFLGKELGGYRNEGDSVPPEVLFTYTEQGRGLFGGMENLVANSSDMFSGLLALTNKMADNNQAYSMDQLLANADPDNNLYNLLKENPDLKTEIEGNLKHIIDTTPDAEDYRTGVADYVTNLMAAKTGTEALQKYNAKGVEGVAMSPETFAAMEKTLGEAGSVILGKTYNTMVGMLYTEAPNLALSHAILRDPVLQQQLQDLVSSGKMDEHTYNDLIKAAEHSHLKVEQIGGFVQTTQQILRDSIKPKQSEKYLRDLDEVLNKYKEAEDQKSKDAALHEMVEKFGPGAGLKGLIQLFSLVQDVEGLNNQAKDENSIISKQELMDKYGIDTNTRKELESRLGWNEDTGKFNAFTGTEYEGIISRNNVSEDYVLAAYKTKQDMVSIVSAFAYETGLNKENSTGKSLLSLFTDSIKNPNYDQDKLSDINRLVDSADEFYLNNSKPTDKRYETEAYIDALVNRGLTTDQSKLGDSSYQNYNDLTTEQKQYAAYTWLNTSMQFSNTTGEYGEHLIRFGLFNRMRRDVYGNNVDRETADSFDIARDPLAVVDMMAITGGKVENNQIGRTMNVLVSAARNATGSINPSEEEIGGQILLSSSLSDTPEDRKIKSILTALAVQHKSEADQIIGRVLTVAQSMSLGQQTETIKAFVNSTQTANESNSEQVLTERFKNQGLSDTDAALLASKMSANYAKQVADPDAELRASLRSRISGSQTPHVGRPVSKATAILGSLGQDADTKSQAFIFPALGLLGAALASGDVAPEAFQEAVGMSLMNLGYLRANNLESKVATAGTSVALSSAYKMRMALEETQGDAGQAILNVASREITMGLVGQLTNPIAKAFDSFLGGDATLDFDKYQSARGLVSSTLAAVGSTILGMVVNNNVVSRLITPQSNEVEARLRAINQQKMQMTNLNESPSEDNFEVEGDNGDLPNQQYSSWANDLDYQNLADSQDISNDFSYSFDNQTNFTYSFTF